MPKPASANWQQKAHSVQRLSRGCPLARLAGAEIRRARVRAPPLPHPTANMCQACRGEACRRGAAPVTRGRSRPRPRGANRYQVIPTVPVRVAPAPAGGERIHMEFSPIGESRARARAGPLSPDGDEVAPRPSRPRPRGAAVSAIAESSSVIVAPAPAWGRSNQPGDLSHWTNRAAGDGGPGPRARPHPRSGAPRRGVAGSRPAERPAAAPRGAIAESHVVTRW